MRAFTNSNCHLNGLMYGRKKINDIRIPSFVISRKNTYKNYCPKKNEILILIVITKDCTDDDAR